MYYVVCLLLYALVLFWFYRVIQTPVPRSQWRHFSGSFVEFGLQGLTKSDVRKRKRRTRALPAWLRFLYWVWFLTHFAIFLGIPILLVLLTHQIQGVLLVPESAFAFSSNAGAMLVFLFGALFSSVAVTCFYGSITNRGVIREADRLYRMGSFAEYPALVNKILSGIFLLIGLPMMMLSLHSYTYFTDREIVFQGVFASETVRYDEIEYAKVWVQQRRKNFDMEYLVGYEKGDAIAERLIYDENIEWLDIRRVDGLLVQKQIDVHRIPIEPDQLQVMQEEMVDWWVQEAIDMCGISEP